MFTLRFRSGGPAPARRTLLHVEELDGRTLPSPLPGGDPSPDGSKGGQVGATSAPQIIEFTAVEIGPGTWRLSGRVACDSPGGLVVEFGGAPESVQGQTATCDADGYFVLILPVLTDGSDVGTVTAVTSNQYGTSNTAYAWMNPTP
jgi:hypothetical protein